MNIQIKKNGENPFFKKDGKSSKYITLDDIIELYSPILSNLGLLVFHFSENGKVKTTIHDTEDESEVCSFFDLFGTKAQEHGSSITYARRYNLCQILNICADEDDDGNKSSFKNEKKTLTEEQKKDPKFADWILKNGIEKAKKVYNINDDDLLCLSGFSK